MANSEKPSYMDENLTEKDKESGQTRLPQPEQEGNRQEKRAEKPYPGDEHRDDKDFERPDEFGDGDRRS